MPKESPTEAFSSASEFSQDRTSRCPVDQKLRERGYKIHTRPDKGDPTWIKDGKIYPQNLLLCTLKLVAIYSESLQEIAQ